MNWLQDIIILVAAGVLVSVVLGRLKLPWVAGLVAAGAIVGPGALGLIHEAAHIDALAEVGVVFLLFTIGLEFSLTRLKRIGRLVFAGGALQVGLTAAAVAAAFAAAGGDAARGVVFGFIIALSSTAVVLRVLADRDELDAPHGRFIVGVLLFQDLCVVPMMLLIPVLAGGDAGPETGLRALYALAKAAGIVAVTVALSRLLLPRIFAAVDRARSREAFVLTVIVVFAGMAWFTSLAGLSLALGAFLAGMVLADSDYAHRAMGEMLPLRDVFTGIFFLSLGLLFDPAALARDPARSAALLVVILAGKTVVAAAAAIAMRFPVRAAVLAGAGLAQFSEFGFVLTRSAVAHGIVAAEEARLLISAGVLTIFITPIVAMLAPRVAAGAGWLSPLERLMGVRGIHEPEKADEGLTGHVVLVGYGVAGRVVGRALKDSGVPYLVLELNAETVSAARAAGERIYYGDITSEETIGHAGVARARALILMINDPRAADGALAAARRYAPDTPRFVRTRYLAGAAALAKIGATDTVVDEVEAGLEMLARVLRQAGLPRNVIMDRVREARGATLPAARTPTLPRRRLGEMAELDDLKIESLALDHGAHGAGRSLRELDLRTRTGALVVAIRRDRVLVDHPDPGDPLRAGDILYLVGPGAAIRRACGLLLGGDPDRPME